MKPILFAKDETAFSDNGLGRLADCISCKVTEGRNGIYECEFQYPVTGEMFDKIKEGRIIGVIHDDTKDIQPFDIYAHTTPLNGVVTFYAHHISYRLSYVILKPMEASSCVDTLDSIPRNTYNDCPFTFWTDKNVAAHWENTIPASVKSLLVGQEGSILDIYGKGEYEWDKWMVKLHINRGRDNGVSIRYGVNLTDLTHEYDESSSYNAVVPYWKSQEDGTVVTLSDGYLVMDDYLVPWTTHTGAIMEDGKGNVIYFKIKAPNISPVPMDLSDAFEEQPTEAQLRAEAKRRLENSEAWLPDENITIQFVNLAETEEYKNVSALQRVSLCDKVSVYCGPLGVSAVKMQVIRVVYNVLTEKYDEIELGSPKRTFADTLNASMESYVAQATADKVTASMLQEAIDNATKQITGASESHVTFVYDSNGGLQEILIMDTESIETAVKVWRWNSGGLGYSSNGYAGPYALAMTQDGAIVADFITTGVLNANLIRAGLLTDGAGKNFWNMVTGEFSLSGNAAFGSSTVSQVVDAANAAIIDVDVEYAKNQSTTTAPTSGWGTDAPARQAGYYIWQRTKTTTKTGTFYSDPTCISGRDGIDGTSVTVSSIQYAPGNSGTSAPSSGWQNTVPSVSAGKWLWVKTTFSNGSVATTCSYMGTDGEDGKSVAIQSVTKKDGVTTVKLTDSDGSTKTLTINDGEDGDNGTPGANGYVHTAWANSADGRTDFSTTVSTNKKYLGVYTDNTAADSTSPSAYSWSLIKGADGEDGDDGIGVSAIVEQYYLSTSSTTQTGGSWSTSQPAWSSGKYIWTRSHITWTDGTETNTSPVLAQAINGANSTANTASSTANTANSTANAANTTANAASAAVTSLDNSLNQQGVFNRLTNNGQTQGIYLSNGLLYINASYINTGVIDGNTVTAKLLKIYNDANELIASFADSIRLGKSGANIHAELDENSFDLFDVSSKTFFSVGDLRDSDGKTTVSRDIYVTYAGNSYYMGDPRVDSNGEIYSVYINGSIERNYSYSYSNGYITFQRALSVGDVISVKYSSTMPYYHYDLGRRKDYSTSNNNIGYYSVAEGEQVTASNYCSHAEGYSTVASGDASHAEGRNTTASNYEAHAEGRGTTASGWESHAEGDGTTASYYASHAEGITTESSGAGAHAEGRNTKATGDASHAEGYLTTASKANSHAEGAYTVASGENSHAEGNTTTASGQYSHAEGLATIASGYAQHVFGQFNIEDTFYTEIVGFGYASQRTNIRTLTPGGNEWLAGTLTQDSDERLKTECGEVPDMSSIKARLFKWNDRKINHDEKEHVGYFAQDVEKVAPCLVDEDAMGYKTLDYNGVMVAKIASLEKRVAELERLIQNMEVNKA